ncbi:MAG TPA: hypothetical protein VF252_06870 [Gemmatimonadales bacterium]
MRHSLLLLGVTAALTACRMTPAPPPVPVRGSDAAVSSLAGVWSGRYWSKATGRHGIIRFTLPEHADTGYGEVEITFSPSLHLSHEASVDYPKADRDEPLPQVPAIIGMTVVHIEHDHILGALAPYWDPDCECRAQTAFEGKLDRQRISGSFTIRRESADRRVLRGLWQVDRER